ncbi:nacht and ankyrin domain-containing protein [Trichoderma sp. SZMC 28011]
MWLRDALPYDITGENGEHVARIMVYGYESNVPNSESFQNLEDLGTTLHSDLRTLLSNGSFKPTVFIAHSLGGLIIKQLLISLSKSSDDIDRKLRRAVYGIAFFGVPHDGMDIRSLIPMCGDGPNRFLLESIGSNSSQILSMQQRDFLEALGGQGESETFSFYETRLSPTALQDERGRWTMSGEPAVLVSKSSATHCRPWENGPEHICAINRTHSEMVKFRQEDPEYDRILGRIKSLAQRAITARKSQIQPNLSQDEQKCLHSLAFRQMQDRRNDIEQAVPGTCEWLLKHKAYMSWAASRGDLLWIKGKPGAGKSTLLKYALNKQRDMPGAKENDLVMSFFFHGRGDALQKTPLGFLRSILHQILKQVPKALSDLVSAYQQKHRDMGDPPEKWQWHAEELWHFFKSSIPKILADRSIWLFVDALDECGEVDAKQLVQRFTSLAKLTPLPEWIYFRICFTCRHYPILSSPGLFEICPEKENESDISTYVQTELRLSSFDEPKLSLIRNLIIFRAAGVFLWARLVVRQVQDLELDGAGSNKIEATIRSIPEGLHSLYKELIYGMGPSSLKLVQWVCFATRPLSTEELRWALVIDTKFPSLQECQQSENYISDSKRMNQRVIKLSRGLAEVTQRSHTEGSHTEGSDSEGSDSEGPDSEGSDSEGPDSEGSDSEGSDTQVVQFIHQSVKDFFMSEGLVALDVRSASMNEAIGMAHFKMSKACICYLKMEEISHSKIRKSDELKAEFPFLHYATTSWVSHSQQSDAMSVPQGDVLELLLWPSNIIVDLWMRIFGIIKTSSSYHITEKTTLIHISAMYGIVGVLTAILGTVGQTTTDIDSRDEFGRTPLSMATEKGNEAVVKLLLNAGAEVNLKDYDNQAPLFYAAETGKEAVVKLLLNAGAGVNLKNDYNQTPLFYAAATGRKAVIELLLDAGAEVDSKNHDNRTPLSWAAERGKEAVVKLLLNAGAEVDSKNSYNQTPLFYAAGTGKEAVVKLLLNAGAEIDSKDNDDMTPLSWAAAKGKETVVKLLLNAGAEVNLKDNGNRTPLSWAVEYGNESVIKLLLDAGAEIDPKETTAPMVLPLA